LTLPFVKSFANAEPHIAGVEWAALVFFLLSLAGESLADAQMNSFKNNPANKGRVCAVGLWRYSRHPNYFFEFCIWCGFYFFNMGSGVFWGAYSPLVILFLLLKVTGIPPAEEQSLKSRGELYREYQKKTSAFIPWWPKT
jgi:steroid 5-alpha reductase family enzyme